MSWEMVDEGWGRAVREFAALSEPQNCREYVAVHQRLGVAAGDRNLDADLRVGDMNDLPWAEAEFDAVTSFRGIWGTTPTALDEAHRVMRPGGRVAFTCWGDVTRSPGGWVLAPLLWAGADELAHQVEMISPGQLGVGEGLLADHGFEPAERVTVPFFWESTDPAGFARTIASTGPAYVAIQEIGLEEFLRRAEELASPLVREGLPLRGEVDVIAFFGTRRT